MKNFDPNFVNISTGITPVEGTEETVRVVSMDKDFHVDCYVCEDCGMQLTDEPESKVSSSQIPFNHFMIGIIIIITCSLMFAVLST